MLKGTAPVVCAVLLLSAAGCDRGDDVDSAPPPSQAGAEIHSALTPTDPDRLPAAEAEAIAALASSPDASPPAHAEGHQGHHSSASTGRLDANEQATLDAQWAEATASAEARSTREAVAAAGYVPASAPVPGVGAHWVKWTLVDQPFDPGRPAMMLMAARRGREPELVGFSYLLRSDTPPEGFAGETDVWHQHAGLCVVNGWVDREDVPSPSECAGSWIAGGDLWMLHAWVVPGWESPWGRFSSVNPRLCAPVGATPDIVRCPPSDAGS